MNESLEVMGFVLTRARKKMLAPREEILRVLPAELSLWRCREEPGWSVEEIVNLAEYLYAAGVIARRLSGPAIWRMENGTGEYSLKALLQYAYILNLPTLPLQKPALPVDTTNYVSLDGEP